MLPPPPKVATGKMKHSSPQSSVASTTGPSDPIQKSTQLLVELLGKLDLSSLKNVTASNAGALSAASNDRLHEIARTIIALNVAADFPSKDHDEHDETLTKLLQICQTIIDFLLAEGKRPQADTSVASKNDINSYNNNLRQENAKLRKLLSLQQKAIAFRRANLWSVTNGCDDDDDVATSAAVDNLPEDSEHSLTANSAKSPTVLQCIYCPKIFSDSNSFAKHLSLRHLSSSIDDGLPPSISSSGSTFMQRLQLQYQKSIAQQTKSQQSTEVSQQNQLVIDRLQEEIAQLKAKLNQTEQALDEEKSARQSFEHDLKNGIAQNVQQIQEQLLEKMEEVKFLRNEALIAADQAANANRTCSELVSKLNTPEQVEQIKPQSMAKSRQDDRVREAKSQVAQRIETQIKRQAHWEMEPTVPREEHQHVESDDAARKQVAIKAEDYKNGVDDEPAQSNVNESVESVVADIEVAPSSTTAPISELKQSLRLQLISQLTTKRSERHAQEKSDAGGQQTSEGTVQSDSEKPKKKKKDLDMKAKKMTLDENRETLHSSSATTNGLEVNKEIAKAEIHSSIESRLREYLQSANAADGAYDASADADSVDSVSINEHEVEKEQPKKAFLDENKFSNAMDKVQRDRELLIHQSRYDYDFVQIESTLRDLIDSKIRSKLNKEQSQKATDETAKLLEGEVAPVNEPLEAVADEERLPAEEERTADSVVEIFDNATEEGDSQTDDVAQPLPTAPPEELEPPALKSILKTRKDNRPRTRRRDSDLSDTEERPPSRRISFSTQIIEFPISPRESSEEDSDVDDDEELGLTVNAGFTANAAANIGTTRRNQMFVIRTMENTDEGSRFDGPALEAEPPEDSFAGEKIFINQYSSSSSSSSDEDATEQPSIVARPDLGSLRTASSHQVVDVEVHQAPTPAQRKSKTFNTLNSLLLADDVSPKQESKQAAPATRVQELADLIERKLQQKSAAEKLGDARPPTGAVDTLASLRQKSNADDYDIYDF